MVLILLITLYVFLLNYFNKSNSLYNLQDNEFIMTVKDFSFAGNKLRLELQGKEDLIADYYIDNYDEYIYLKNNIQYGQVLALVGSLSIPSGNTTPNGFNYQKYLVKKNIYYILKVKELNIRNNSNKFIYWIKNKINKRINNVDYKGYIRSFIFGDKSELKDETYKNYQKLGIAHIFAISGMHIGLLSGLLLLILKKKSKFFKYLIVDLFLLFYFFIVSFSFSVLRCLIFFLINSINKLLNLDLKNWQITIVVISIICLIDYKAIYDIGFLFSIFTVSGIMIANDFIKAVSKIASLFKLSFVALIFSLPITLSNYYEFNLLSIIYNMVFVPFVSIVIYPFSLLTFVFPFLIPIFKFMIDFMESISLFLTQFNTCIYLDFNIIEVVIWYLMAFITFRFEKY